MIIIVANCRDQVAKKLVKRWSAHSACLLTPLDLSKSGWSYRVGNIDSSTAVAGGIKISVRDIKGVIVRLPWILEDYLDYIIPQDRAYIATEMSAFLMSWLTALKCPVLNRPTPSSLLGPDWCNEKWVYTASQLGIPVYSSRKLADFTAVDPARENLQSENKSDDIVVTLIGKRCFGAMNRTMAEDALALANAAGVEFMEVRFCCTDYTFKGVSLLSETITDEVADALIDHFRKSNIIPHIEVEA